MNLGQRLPYYRRVVQSVGVPSMWEEDAIQDIALRVWRAQKDTPTVVRYAAIDSVRRYGSRSRHVARPELDRETDPGYEPMTSAERAIDFRQAWRSLTHRHRETLILYVLTRGARTNREHVRIYQIRQMLRKALAA